MAQTTEYIRVKTLAARLDCGVSSVWRMVSDGRLPPPSLKLGQRCTLWDWGIVQKFLTDRSASKGSAS